MADEVDTRSRWTRTTSRSRGRSRACSTALRRGRLRTRRPAPRCRLRPTAATTTTTPTPPSSSPLRTTTWATVAARAAQPTPSRTTFSSRAWAWTVGGDICAPETVIASSGVGALGRAFWRTTIEFREIAVLKSCPRREAPRRGARSSGKVDGVKAGCHQGMTRASTAGRPDPSAPSSLATTTPISSRTSAQGAPVRRGGRLLQKSSVKKKRSFKRQRSQTGRGKPGFFLQVKGLGSNLWA